MRTVAGIAVAGAIGALARYGIGGLVADRTWGSFPWGTLVINVSGSFLVGFLFVLFTERSLAAPELRTAVTIGFLGAYTTFSTFSLETFRLMESGAWGLAMANVGASLVLGLGAAWAGVSAGKAIGP